MFMESLSMLLFLLCLLVAFSCSSSNTIPTTNSSSSVITIAKPGCATKCGDLSIPYPFGIEKDCSINPSFQINCTTIHGKPKPLIAKGYEVTNISGNHLYIKNNLTTICYDDTLKLTRDDVPVFNLLSTIYTFSDGNKFTLIGCDDMALVMERNQSFSTGCSSSCLTEEDLVDGTCDGVGCCQTSIPKGLNFFVLAADSLLNHSLVSSFNPCGHAFVGKQDTYKFNKLDLLDPLFVNRTIDNVPLELDWAIGTENCVEAKSFSDYACHPTSFCVDADNNGIGGYNCVCPNGYQGNPYIDPGCHDINECDDSPCDPKGICTNLPGNFSCTCQNGYAGDGTKDGQGCVQQKSEFPVLKLSLGLGFGLLFLITSISWLYFIIQQRKLKKQRQKFFEQNGGLLLKNHMKSNESGGDVKSTRIFTYQELKKATNNYAKNRILGKGGNGVVYKGILQDKHVVAIKKSIKVEKNDIESFINEVTILTQINHRNVVKLFGCCLETESPILVYEYIANGTLDDHIHKNSDKPWFSWPNRLKIATEAANALAYLHSAAALPIFHRDVKSANILLDEFHTAKIADFGASRLLNADESQVMTQVQGTLGYMDPEYFITQQLTGKSDVYSFGVVIAELMTGREAISPETGKNLATFFITSVKDNKLFQSLENRVLREGSLEQLQGVAELILGCLNMSGEKRPTMREVALELERLGNLHMNPQVLAVEVANSEHLTPEESDLYMISQVFN